MSYYRSRMQPGPQPRDHYCPVCQIVATRAGLKRHIASAHPQSNARPVFLSAAPRINVPEVNPCPRLRPTRHGDAVAGATPQIPAEHAARSDGMNRKVWEGFDSFDDWMASELELNSAMMIRLSQER